MPAKSHGESNTLLYKRWLLMKRSCYNPNAKSYQTIGRQGIEVYPEWRDNYMAFKSYVLEHGYKDGLIIDRIDRSDDFKPNNLKFSTPDERQKVRSSRKRIICNGQSKSLSEWAREIGVTRQTLYARIKRAPSPQHAIQESFKLKGKQSC